VLAYRDERFDGGPERGLHLAAVAVELAERDLALHPEEVALGAEDLGLEPPLLLLLVGLPLRRRRGLQPAHAALPLEQRAEVYRPRRRRAPARPPARPPRQVEADDPRRHRRRVLAPGRPPRGHRRQCRADRVGTELAGETSCMVVKRSRLFSSG
jgi:hypothetical protein